MSRTVSKKDVQSPTADVVEEVVDERPQVFNIVSKKDLRWGDAVYPNGTVLGQITLPPGVEYPAQYVTRCIEDCFASVKPSE